MNMYVCCENGVGKLERVNALGNKRYLKRYIGVELLITGFLVGVDKDDRGKEVEFTLIKTMDEGLILSTSKSVARTFKDIASVLEQKELDEVLDTGLRATVQEDDGAIFLALVD